MSIQAITITQAVRGIRSAIPPMYQQLAAVALSRQIEKLSAARDALEMVRRGRNVSGVDILDVQHAIDTIDETANMLRAAAAGLRA